MTQEKHIDTKLIGFTSVAFLLGIGFALATGAYADGVNAGREDMHEKGVMCEGERHEQMEEIFENRDYSAWKQYVDEHGAPGHMAEMVTEDNFSTFAEMHKAMEDGDMDRAQELHSMLGLGDVHDHMMGMKHKGGHHGMMHDDE